MNRFFAKIIVCFILFAGLQVGAYAQTPDKNVSIPEVITGKTSAADTTKASKKPTDQKDLPDVIRGLFGIKPSPSKDSVTSKPSISVVPAVGYTLVTRLAFVLSGNAAWRMDANTRISSVLASVSYTQNQQIIVPILSNIWTKNNKFNLVGDYRFYRYPQSTFGLGSASSMDDEDPMDFTLIRFYETALTHITGNVFAGIGYNLDSYSHVSNEGPLSGKPSAYKAYGEENNSRASGPTFEAIYDSRDNGINPSKGWFASAQLRTSEKFFGATQNWSSLILDVRKYVHFPAGSKNVLGFWTYEWLMLGGKASYLNLPSTGWDPNTATGRGYIQGRYRGAQMVYLETEYRFGITRNGLLSGVLFVNAESLSAQQGTRLQTIQPAFGPGLRIKLNKTSKTNIAFDYGFGREGSRGLFIDVGEVF